MMRTVLLLLSTLFWANTGVQAAALVPVPALPSRLATPGFEPNRGQAAPSILFLGRGLSNLAVARDGILLSPFAAKLQFEGSLPGGSLAYAGPLPGVANYFIGASPAAWVTNVPRYRSARVNGIFAGVDAEYTLAADGRLHLRLHLAAGVDPASVGFLVEKSGLARPVGGTLTIYFGTDFRLSPRIVFPPPLAVQMGSSGPLQLTARYGVRSTQRFAITVEGRDPALPLTIEFIVDAPPLYDIAERSSVRTATGEIYVAAMIADATGKNAPFPQSGFDGCGSQIATPKACTDVSVSKFQADGTLAWVTYLAGRTSEQPEFLALAPGGALVVAGGTNSSDFPSTGGAQQPAYAGPAPTLAQGSASRVMGDLFATRLNAHTGTLLTSTFLGGPEADSFGAAALGDDGSLHLFHKWLTPTSPGMPTTRGALLGACAGTPCLNSYAARLSPSLDQLLYGTYLPGSPGATSVLHTDGSLYFAGGAEAGFPTTPGAYQRLNAGQHDAIIGRLDATGTRLLFATYIGGPGPETILRMAVPTDGSVWADISAETHRLVRLDAKGERLLAERPLPIYDLAAAPDGGVFAKAYGSVPATVSAFLGSPCGAGSYVRLNAAGETVFATYLPYWFEYDFTGSSARGLPLLRRGEDELYEVDENADAGVYTGCVVDAASYANADVLSPGAIVTLFGSQMGPREGVTFQLVDGRLPTELGGTRVFVNGDPIPLLYVSYGQINAVLPYTLAENARPEIQVVRPGAPGNVLKNSLVQRAGITIFHTVESEVAWAAALNEDGTVNSASNPARPGSVVVLFGTGGGATVPPSVAGGVTPSGLRPLEYPPIVRDLSGSANELAVEYAGAAPGLVAGVAQINVRLPNPIPPGAGLGLDGRAYLQVITRGSSTYSAPVAVHVR
ncbi:MAG: hypothetical protein IPJ98_11130 [Bryobacterales bacterium]|nr:hypothetical protein [Bryobacterales bacterium]